MEEVEASLVPLTVNENWAGRRGGKQFVPLGPKNNPLVVLEVRHNRQRGTAILQFDPAQ